MDDAQSRSWLLSKAQDMPVVMQGMDVFLLKDPALERMGEEHKALASAKLTPGHSPAFLRVVTAGVAAITREGEGLCTAMAGRGQPLAASGIWITDGAFIDLSFRTVSERLGTDAALALWGRAAAYARMAVEAELVCAIRHSAAQRLARWLSEVLGAQNEASLTQAQLAELSGLQRTSVCAAMASLQAGQALKVMRGRIRLRSFETLQGQACDCRTRTNAMAGEDILTKASGDGAALGDPAADVRRPVDLQARVPA